MNESPSLNPKQDLSISDDASINDTQIAGVAGRDQNVTQIKAKVVNYLNVYDPINGSKPIIETKSLSRQEYRQRQSLLKNVKKFWITDYLERSLHARALIELKSEVQSNLVPSHSIGNIEEFPEYTKSIPENRNDFQIFKKIGEGEPLLILGEPGSGKTTTLLKIAENLITQAEKDLGQFIPVFLNLSSWASERQTIAEWIVKELDSKYLVPKAVSRNWIDNQDFILLLDGLDEVKVDRREACVQAINEFIKSYGLTEVIICSRLRDYEVLSSRLQVESAVCLQSLTQEQIELYLDRAGNQLKGVKTLLQEDEALQELAKSPLILSIIALAYQGMSAEELPHHASIEERRQHLLNAYVERMFRRKEVEKKYPKAQVKHYLSWLSQQLNRTSQSIFLIERMQPDWLSFDEKWAYQVGNTITFLAAAFLSELFIIYIPKISGIIPSKTELYHDFLASLSLYIPIALFLFGFNQNEIKTFETIKSPFKLIKQLPTSRFWRTVKKILCQSFLYSLLYGIYTAAILGFIWWNNPSSIDKGVDPVAGLMVGTLVGLIVGVIIGFPAGLLGHYACLSGLFFSLIYGITFYASGAIRTSMGIGSPLDGLVSGVLLGWLAGMIFGLIARFGKPESIIFGGLASLCFGFLFMLDKDFYNDALDIKDLVSSPTMRLFVGFSLGLFFGMVLGLIVHWTDGMQGPEIETKIEPNQGIWKSVKSAVFIGIVVSLCWGVFMGLLTFNDPTNNFLSNVSNAVSIGTFVGFVNGGGRACIRHFTLRFLLWRKGNIPWNYARFLDSACDLIFLQKVGGGYIFVHRLLMEHFAQMEISLEKTLQSD